MADLAHLGLFFVVVFGVIALPGLDMAFVMASSVRGGSGAGFAAVAGVIAGGVAHVLMGVLGVAAILAVWPPLFNALLVAGALYIGWIGLSLLRLRSALALPEQAQGGGGGPIFLQGMATCLLNPKAYVFMLAIFPQFLRPADGPLWSQAAVLGVIVALTQAGIYGAVALSAAGVRRRLQASARAGLLATRAVGLTLVAAALLTVVQGWRLG